MTEPQVQEVLTRLFSAFPSLGDYYAKHRATLREVWLQVLSPVEFQDASAVVSELISGDREMIPNYEYDRTAILIRRQANAIRSARDTRLEMETKYLRPHYEGTHAAVQRQRTGHIAIELGKMAKRNEISSEEKAKRMDELMLWDKGGNAPAWLNSMPASKKSQLFTSVRSLVESDQDSQTERRKEILHVSQHSEPEESKCV